MKYNYNSSMECFVREDGLGKKIWVNSYEAHRIMTLHTLGNSVGEICNKINFSSSKVRESTVMNFIKNVDAGNITLSEDYPVPLVEDLTIEQRISKLEADFEEFKMRLKPKKSNIDKVKAWLKN